MNRKLRLLFSLAFIWATIGYSQSIKHKFDKITVKDGLAHSTVNSSMQDKTGYLWFATYGGISKYDGYNLTNYSNDPKDPFSLSQNSVNHLCEDNSGRIWIAFNNEAGVDYYDKMSNKFYNFKHSPENENSISGNNITYIFKDSKKNIWFCANNALNLLIEEEGNIQFKRFFYPEGSVITWGLETNEGKILVLGDHIFYFDTESYEFIPAGDVLPTSQYNSVAEDKNGNVYLGTINLGLLKLEYNNIDHTYNYVENFELNVAPDNRCCITIDSLGQFWIGVETKGLFKYNPEKDEMIKFVHNELDENSLSENTAYSLYIDKTGILWIGTFNQGLCKYDLYSKKFYHIKSQSDNPNSLINNQVTAIHGLSGNELWVSNRGDGGVNQLLFNSDGIQINQYIHDAQNENSIATNNIFCLVQRKNGNVWAAGGNTQVSIIKPKDFDSDGNTIIERKGINGWTFSIFEDSENMVWGGTWGGGLWRYFEQLDSFAYYTHDPEDKKSLCDNVVWSFFEDNNNNIWIGGNNNGISILQYNQKNNAKPAFINISYDSANKYSLSNNTINTFFQDSKGTLWIATNNGLNQLLDSELTINNISTNSKLKFKVFSMEDGLPSNGINGIIEDDNHNLWISTGNGISFFNMQDSSFTNYYESDGLQSDEFWNDSYFENSNGMAFFGGKNGISAFYPEEIKVNPFKPRIALTDLKIFNKSVKVGEKINGDVVLKKPINELDEIVLNHKNNVFSIDFAALHFTQPEQNQYAYYLEGFEEDWNYLDSRTATYTNLNRGKYTFRVIASNNNGVWNKEGKSLVIRIKPPWWKTWIFRFFLLGLAGFAYYNFVQNRMKSQLREKNLLQEKIEKGENELQVRKDEIEKQKREIEEKNKKEFEINYLHSGISKFADIIAASRKDIDELTNNLIVELVKYTETNAGVVYLADDKNPENIQIKNSAAYCFDSDIVFDKIFEPGEGYIGTCYKTREILQIDNLPEGYLVFKSGLGQTSLKHGLLVPILQEDSCLGVIELGSIKEIEKYKIELITKLTESLASVIAINKANKITEAMLNENKIQSEELQAQEEELRQNLEEMQATQEELRRQMEASNIARDEAHFEEALTNAMLDSAKESIYFKDLESKFLKASKSMKNVFNVEKVEDIYGKSDFDFFTEEHARPAFEDEQNIIKTGKPIVDKIEKETHADGRVSYVTTTKMPLKNSEGKIIGTFGISRNITEFIELKEELEKVEEESIAKDAKINELQAEIADKIKLIKKLGG
ncbi:MAG: PAS domain-containing protein [Bacteroidales bacterium]|nr:PAS domain-containing protein [Bacteroidales bacterium]MBN2819060.1 PAS domain-containing protein [Bacteroidales bacterium]